MTPLDTILSALAARDCHPSPAAGGGHTARCPAHADKNPSLSIATGDDGRVLLHCHAGCPFSAVMAALNLSEGDAFPPRDPAKMPRAKPPFPVAAFLAKTRAYLAALAKWYDSSPDLDRPNWLDPLLSLHGGFARANPKKGYRQALVLPVCDPSGREVGVKLRFLGPTPEGKPKSQNLGKSGILGYSQLVSKPTARAVIASGEKDQLHGVWLAPSFAWISPSAGEAQDLTPFRDLLTSRPHPPTWIPDVDAKGREAVASVVGKLAIPGARAVWLPLDGSHGHKDLADYLDPIETEERATIALSALVEGATPYAPPPPDDSAPAVDPYSEDALARDMTRQWKNARHVHAWGRWLLWDGARWRADETLEHMTQARAYLRTRSDELLSQDHETDRAAAKAAALAKSILSARSVAAIVSLARSNAEVAATTNEWDRDPWLLGTPAGVVDLRSGDLRDARPEDRITKLAGCAPAPRGARSDLWEKFLSRITDGEFALEDYLRRFAGYALTGLTREHAFAFGYGEGQNGKSVFLNVLRAVMGEYAIEIPTEMLMTSQSDRHPTELAQLRGVRLATSIETEEGRAWAEAKIKSLTGGDPIRARFMRQDFFEFQAQFKLFIAGNHKPALRNVDKAMRRRLHLVPFTVTIPDAEIDPRLTEKLLADAPAILRWAVEGCAEWQRVGLRPPEIITRATDDYLGEEDVFVQWMTDCGDLDPKAWQSSAELWNSWKGWAKTSGEDIGTRTRFTKRLEEKRLEKEKRYGMRGWVGLRLRDPEGEQVHDDGYRTESGGWEH